MTRLLDPKLIPNTLWDSNSKVVQLPPELSKTYVVLIESNGLTDLANSRNRKISPIGGQSAELTDAYFAQAFGASVARAEIALLDPKGDLGDSSNMIISYLSGNRLRLTDVPCGSGAASFAFLTTVAELRANGVVPREPLDVFLIGGEISQSAQNYARSILAEIRNSLEAQAIFVQEEFLDLDVTNSDITSEFITQVIGLSKGASKSLLVIANFSGFLYKDENQKEAIPQIKSILGELSGRQSILVWIEPDMNRVTVAGGFFGWVWKFLHVFGRHHAGTNQIEDLAQSRFCLSKGNFRRPLSPSESPRVGIAVICKELIDSK